MTTRGRILLVDDDTNLLQATLIRLKHAGYETIAAGDGYEGVSKAKALHPDAIVLDVRMPRMDGLTAIGLLRVDPTTTHIPVVMVSASIRDQQRALDAGARCFLTKPYDGEKWLATVEAAVHEHKARSRQTTESD